MIELKHVNLEPEYSAKWNVSCSDFIQLYKDDKLLRDTLYRKGGMGGEWKDGYMMLLKHTESYWQDDITSIKKDKPHLESCWCIINKNGIEKVIYPNFVNLYHVSGVIYCINSDYYNIETNESYGHSFKLPMKSTDFIFIDTTLDRDKTKRGILKINIHTGETELFK